MAEEVKFTINGDEFADYAPFEGIGSSDLLPFAGSVQVLIKSAQPRKLGADKAGFLVVAIVQDADAKGLQLLNNVHATGKDKNGKPMSRQLGDVFLSIGKPVTTIQGLKGKQFDEQAARKQIEGQVAYVDTSAEEYEGRWRSQIDRWITSEQYKERVASGAHRKPHPPVVGQPVNRAGNPAANGGKEPVVSAADLFSTGGAAAKPTAAPSATDLL